MTSNKKTIPGRNLKRRLEEADIWDKLYENEKMLKTSISNRFTWGDVLDGMVDILPPREIDTNLTQTLAEANRKFMSFKSKKMKELFGLQRPHKPSYKSLYTKGQNFKEINDRSFRSLIQRHRSEKDKLFKNQNIHTPNLPKITEEDCHAGESKSNSDKSHNEATTGINSDQSHDSPAEEVPKDYKQPQTGSDVVEKVRKRKLSHVPTVKGTLTLAKSNIVLEGVPGQLKLPQQVSKQQQTKRKDSADSFSGYAKLPPISNSEEY